MNNQNEMVRTGLSPQALEPSAMDKPIELNIAMPPESAAAALLAWEQFRLAYNFLLVLWIFIICATSFGRSAFQNWEFWWYLAYCVFAANVCFCVGLWIVGWLSVAGADAAVVRRLLFVAGVIFACSIAGEAMVSWLRPPPLPIFDAIL